MTRTDARDAYLQAPMSEVTEGSSNDRRARRSAHADGQHRPFPSAVSLPDRVFRSADWETPGYADFPQWRRSTVMLPAGRADRGEERWRGYRFRPWQGRGDDTMEENRRYGFEVRGESVNGGWLEIPGELPGRPTQGERDPSWQAAKETPMMGYSEYSRQKEAPQGRDVRPNATPPYHTTDSLYKGRLDFFMPTDPAANPESPSAHRGYGRH
ncbi:MAG: hypothetical protein WCP34_03450 [Pseudomonadota bacterium]